MTSMLTAMVVWSARVGVEVEGDLEGSWTGYEDVVGGG